MTEAIGMTTLERAQNMRRENAQYRGCRRRILGDNPVRIPIALARTRNRIPSTHRIGQKWTAQYSTRRQWCLQVARFDCEPIQFSPPSSVILFAGGDSNLFAYVANDPINFIDPSGLIFGGAVDAGEGYGDYATDYWAQRSIDPNSSAFDRGVATAAGLISSLWTTNTSDQTALTLAGAYVLRVVGPFPQSGVPKAIQQVRRYFRIDPPHHGKGWHLDGEIPKKIGNMCD